MRRAGVVDVRGRSDFSRFGPVARGGPFCLARACQRSASKWWEFRRTADGRMPKRKATADLSVEELLNLDIGRTVVKAVSDKEQLQ